MSNTQPTSGIVICERLTWMMVGPLVLVVLTYAIVSKGDGWLTAADIAYFFVLAVMLLARWLEFRGGNPQKATGEPATQEDLYRYLLGAGMVGLAAWVVANFIANHWLTR